MRFVTINDDEGASELAAYSSREILYDVKDELERSADPEYLRRKLHRQRIRDYRRSKVLELQHLQKEAAALQAHIARLQGPKKRGPSRQDCQLPWREVAMALRDAADASQACNASLKTKLHKHRELLRAMTSWVSAMSSVQRFPNANAATWRNICLFKSDESRRLGFEWMTNHMLHHTNAVLDECAFPTAPLHATEHADYMDLHISWDDAGRYRLFQRHQTIMHTSLESITHALHRMYISDRVSVANIAKEDLDTQFLNDSGRYSRTQEWSANPLHFLRRQFTEPGHRSIIVGQNILEDEKYPVGKYICDAQAWIVVTQLAPGVILYQNYYTAEQLHTKDGVALPLEDDVWSTALSLHTLPTLAAKQRAFERHVQHQWVHIIKAAEAGIRAMCTASP
ncbi:hypothetical protein SPRG_08559 [Saprolegnia parasitica CBS 223.65]|uniref:START domain-containing protein n=1 Tax=Saprolegnia parasitica (strain CBS 223.65) TaxID=695850 RepID=A0A067CHE5_SAPPC|nr:hypothetical protein SPRG_08559 [Saprolegnia parasitica CBS 223.65]KDO26197.1 hypothetical protein SPRG_08559 [Saprolegnia parasitica CBS 223.65]|eukprot:XP_012203190.1 hypothetical protein SPRG_08559 [Saprolegnia parasitica CBS 223.65]